MLKEIINYRKKCQRLEEGFLFMQNNLFLGEKKKDSFIDDFNGLIEEVFDDELFSKQTKTLVETFKQDIGKVILKESKVILKEDDLVETILVLNEQLRENITEEYTTGFMGGPIVSQEDQVRYAPEIGKMDQEPVDSRILKHKTIFDWLTETDDKLVKNWQEKGLEIIKSKIEDLFEEDYPGISELKDLSKYDLDDYDFQFYYLFNFPAKKFDKQRNLFTSEETSYNRKIVRRINDYITSYRFKSDQAKHKELGQ